MEAAVGSVVDVFVGLTIGMDVDVGWIGEEVGVSSGKGVFKLSILEDDVGSGGVAV